MTVPTTVNGVLQFAGGANLAVTTSFDVWAHQRSHLEIYGTEAIALRQGRPHRASGELALHVLEVLDAFGRSSTDGRHIAITSTAERPAPVPLGADEAVFLAGD